MKIIRWLCALLLLLLLSAACAAFAEGASVTLVLGDNTPTNGNKHYVKDGRTYSRDLTVPLVNGQQVIKASQTGSAVTYLCPVSPDASEIVVDFPYGADWTTIEVNGQLLTKEQGAAVEIVQDWTVVPFYRRDEAGNIAAWDFYGGNLAGIRERLSYLKAFGVSIIYLSPIFESASNHR